MVPVRTSLGVHWKALVRTENVRRALGVRWRALVHTDHPQKSLGVHWKALVHTENVTYLKGRFFYSCKSVNFGL